MRTDESAAKCGPCSRDAGAGSGPYSSRGLPGLTPTDQVPAVAVATVEADGPVTDTWRALFDTHALRDALVRAVRTFARGRTSTDLYDALDERGVPGEVCGLVDKIARGDQRAAWRLVADVVPDLGSGRSAVEDLLAVASLFDALPDAVDEAPTLAVVVRSDFRERRRAQRVDVCRLVARLAAGFDVRLVATGATRAWLAHEHRADLPGVREWYDTPHGEQSPEAVASEALADLDPDGRAVSVLWSLSDEPSHTCPYATLYAGTTVSKARVRQAVGRLADLDLVEPFGPDADRMVELRPAGRAVVDALDTTIGRQRDLEESVSETPKSHTQAVLSREHGEGDRKDSEPYRTAFLDRPQQDALATTATAGGISLVKEPLAAGEDADDRRTRHVSYDSSRDEALVSVRATDALHHVVSVATALASPQFLDRALPVERIDRLDEPPAILRDARNIGALSTDALDDPEALREAFVEWGEDLADMTTDLRHREYDDRDRFRSLIMRSAHGLAGSLVHLLDVFGVDVTRELRVPGGLDRDHLDEIARSVAISTAIQSQYGVFAPYRHLFETPSGEPPLTPEVDAADPTGELLGAYVLRGPDVHRLRSPLRHHLEEPAEPNDDAPEFAVSVPVEEPGREAFGDAVERILARKDLTAPPEVVATLYGLVPSANVATQALNHLGTETRRPGRALRADELRYALRHVDAERILPDLAPTVGRVVAALLDAEEPLSQTALAEAADVSTQSIRNHRDRLAALDLVRVDGTTYRLALSFPTDEERADPVVPDPVATDTTSFDVTLLDAASDLIFATLPPERAADPEDPVAGHVHPPPDPWGIVEESARLGPWVRVAVRLTGATPSEAVEADRVTVAMGPPIEQTPLVDAGERVSG